MSYRPSLWLLSIPVIREAENCWQHIKGLHCFREDTLMFNLWTLSKKNGILFTSIISGWIQKCQILGKWNQNYQHTEILERRRAGNMFFCNLGSTPLKHTSAMDLKCICTCTCMLIGSTFEWYECTHYIKCCETVSNVRNVKYYKVIFMFKCKYISAHQFVYKYSYL